MNNKWMKIIDNKEIGGWVKVPTILIHEYKKIGITAEEALFIIDILSNSEDFVLYDSTYMNTHGCDRTLRRIRKSLYNKNLLKWERFNKINEKGKIVSSGFKYNLDNLIVCLSRHLDTCVQTDGHMWPQKSEIAAATKESLSKESIPKESFNNIPNMGDGVNADPPDCVNFNNLDLQGETTTIDKEVNYSSDILDQADEFISEYEDVQEYDYEDDQETYDWASFSEPDFDTVQTFIYEYEKAREAYKLPPLKNIGSHSNNIKLFDKKELQNLINYPYQIERFFKYCDDRSYDMNIRRYECNSDRSPSIMFQESVYRRFIDWYNLNY